jgi:hypothetical protein
MPDIDEMVEMLIAPHGLDDALYEACERILALERAGDWAGLRRGAGLPRPSGR